MGVRYPRAGQQLQLFSELHRRPPAPRNYAEYLRSPRWAELRDAALRRDGYSCRTCPAAPPARLQVHHRRYPEVLGTETIEDLTTLCFACHTIIEWFRCDAIRDGSRRR